MIIKAPHPSIAEPKTFLTASAAAAATAITVANNAGFASNDYTVIGVPGQEGAELHKISSVSGNTTINYVSDALKFAISTNTQVTYIKYNKVKFYLGDWSARYSTGTITVTKDSATVTGSGTSWGSITTDYALLLNGKWYDIKSQDSATQITLTAPYSDETNSGQSYALVPFSSQATVDIAVDQEETLWDDTDALAEDYYRTEYYNSTSTAASTRSAIISASVQEGFSEFSLQALEDEVLTELRDPLAQRRSREEIDRDINNALRDLVSTVVSDVQEDYLSSYTTINFVANVSEYKLPDDFRKLNSAWIAFNGSDYIKAMSMRISDDNPTVSYSQAWPYYYLRDNVIGVRPTPTGTATAGIKMWYDRRFPSLVNQGDEVPHLLRDYKRLLVDYALEKASMAEDEMQKAVNYRTSYESGKKMMARVLQDRDTTTNRKVEITNGTDMWY